MNNHVTLWLLVQQQQKERLKYSQNERMAFESTRRMKAFQRKLREAAGDLLIRVGEKIKLSNQRACLNCSIEGGIKHV